MGYKTSGSCRLRGLVKGRPAELSARVVEISNDGAVVLCSAPLAVGSRFGLQLDGFSMAEVPVGILANQGDTGSGYRLTLKLDRSWPYHVWSSLITMTDTATPEQAANPPCLETLGLALPCTADRVEEAFHRLVRKVHPDRGGSVEEFVRLRNAYLEALELLGASR